MNGRIYDPHLGRFIQADPFIQAADFTQSYNRYSYGFNNPLNGTDPSGYIFGIDDILIGAAIGLAVGAAGDALDVPLLSAVGGIVTCSYTGGLGCAPGFAFGSTLGAGGSFGDALTNGAIAGVSAFAFSEIGGAFTADSGFYQSGGLGHIGAHGMAGGIMNVLAGGKFGHGFVSAGFTKAANVNRIFGTSAELRGVRIVAASVIGGTVSEMTGGKFANGAITAAFGQAYNGEKQAAYEELMNSHFAGFIREEGMSILMRTGQAVGGAGQVLLGGGMCYGSGGLACAAGSAIALKGVDNFQAGIRGENSLSLNLLINVTGSETAGNLINSGLDLGTSVYGVLRPIPKMNDLGNPMKYFMYRDPKVFQPAYRQATTTGLTVEALTSGATLYGTVRN